MLQITTQRTTTPKAKPDESNLGFGVHYTDHMLIIDHDEEQGWHDARIVPYQPLELDPAAMVFHYAMESFEGLKLTAPRTLHSAVPPGQECTAYDQHQPSYVPAEPAGRGFRSGCQGHCFLRSGLGSAR